MRVLILSAPVGAGHDAAARGLAGELRERGAEVEIDDGLALMGRRIHHVVVDGYRWELEHAVWSWRLLYRTTRSPRLIRWAGSLLALRSRRRLLARIDRARPDRIVSTYPLVSAVLAVLRRTNRLHVPCSALVTDFDPHPGWVHPDLDANLGVWTSMPVLRPVRPPVPLGAASAAAGVAIRARLGIPANRRMVLIAGGVWGIGNLHGAARAVAGAPGAHAVVVTGQNAALRRRLEADPQLAGATVLGYTAEMPELLVAADLLVQHAGGLTCLEGFAAGVPVVMFDPLPGHGEDNSREMEAAGMVLCAESAGGLRRLLGDARFWQVDAPAMVVRARSMFDRRSAADELECQPTTSGAPPLVALRRSVRPVAGTFALILLVAMTRAQDAVAISAHLVR
jgi:processive 1,2-diacylglycerol beta-glucosyltransferase